MKIALQNETGERLVTEHGVLAHPDDSATVTLQLGAVRFRPGLINAHDHLYLNHYSRLGSPPYPDAYAWGRDIHERWRAEIDCGRRLPRRDALLFGAFKNIIAGVTTVVHHDDWDVVLDGELPLRAVRVHVLHSLGFEPDLAGALAASQAPAGAPVCIHLAEGTSARAFGEIEALSRAGLLNDRLLAVHVIAVSDADVERLHLAGAAIVWCPTSNLFLFGTTAPRALITSGIDVLLGTDALLTGTGTLLDELRAARALGYVDDETLGSTVGATAARRLGLHPPVLAPGAPADLIALRAPLFDAHPRDVALVLVRGRPALADESLGAIFELNEVAAEPVVIGGVPKLVAAPLATVARRVWESDGYGAKRFAASIGIV
jgi:hypothetical protein